jgi:hypothetical protein
MVTVCVTVLPSRSVMVLVRVISTGGGWTGKVEVTGTRGGGEDISNVDVGGGPRGGGADVGNVLSGVAGTVGCGCLWWW